MAKIKSIDIEDGRYLVTLRITEKEANLLKPLNREFILLPTDTTDLDETLTTEKIGNGNRIMMPNKLLQKHNIKKLLKNVQARIFELEENKMLLIKLEEHKPGVPVFKEEADDE